MRARGAAYAAASERPSPRSSRCAPAWESTRLAPSNSSVTSRPMARKRTVDPHPLHEGNSRAMLAGSTWFARPHRLQRNATLPRGRRRARNGSSERIGWALSSSDSRRRTLSPGMMHGVELLQPLARDVRVDRRRRDVGVAEQQLHDAQIRAVIEQMRRERVAQHVRRQRRGRYAGAHRMALDERPEGLPRKRRMALCEEELVALRDTGELRPHGAQVARHPCNRFVAHWHQPLLAALADDAHDAGIMRDLRELETGKLRNTQAGRVQRFEHRAIA